MLIIFINLINDLINPKTGLGNEHPLIIQLIIFNIVWSQFPALGRIKTDPVVPDWLSI